MLKIWYAPLYQVFTNPVTNYWTMDLFKLNLMVKFNHITLYTSPKHSPSVDGVIWLTAWFDLLTIQG